MPTSKTDEVQLKIFLGVHRIEIIELFKKHMSLQEDIDTPVERLQASFEAVFEMLRLYYDTPCFKVSHLSEDTRKKTFMQIAEYIVSFSGTKKVEVVDGYFDVERSGSGLVPFAIFVSMVGLNPSNVRKLGNTMYKAEPLVNVAETLQMMVSKAKECI